MSTPAGPAPAFDVLDAFEGFAGLVRRSPTLDGSVPLRVARGCLPFLEGNSFGWQVTLSRPLRIRRGALGPRLVDEELAHLHAAALPRLVARGLLPRDGPWHRALRRGFAWFEGGRLRLFTGLLVRPAPGLWLRVSGCANRRNALLEVEEALVPDDGALVPLVLTLTLPGSGLDRVRLQGEIACLAPLSPAARFEELPLAQAPEVARAHLAFYDRAYFEAKKRDVTGKYRRLMARVRRGPGPAPTEGDAGCRVGDVVTHGGVAAAVLVA